MWVDGWPWQHRSDILGWFERAGWRLRSSRLVWLVGGSAGAISKRQAGQESTLDCIQVFIFLLSYSRQTTRKWHFFLSACICAFSITAFLKGDSILEVCLCRLQCQPAYYEQGQWVICSMRLLCFFSCDRQRKRGGGERSFSPSVLSIQMWLPSISVQLTAS